MFPPDDVEILTGLPEHLRQQAAEIYYDAFKGKMAALKARREQLVAVLADGFCTDLALAAVKGGELLGIAGLQYGRRRFSGARLQKCIEQLGGVKGTLFWLFFRLFESTVGEDELMIESLAISPAMRGMGAGSRLIEYIVGMAKEKGFRAVTLEVVDTNPDARRLYERLGFEAVKTTRLPWLRHLKGFSAWTRMVRRV